MVTHWIWFVCSSPLLLARLLQSPRLALPQLLHTNAAVAASAGFPPALPLSLEHNFEPTVLFLSLVLAHALLFFTQDVSAHCPFLFQMFLLSFFLPLLLPFAEVEEESVRLGQQATGKRMCRS